MNEKQMRVECAHGYGNAQGPRRTRGAVGAAHGATQGCESSLLSTLEPIAGGEPLRRVRGRAVPAVLCQEARPAEPRAGGVFPAAADRVFRGDRFGARDGLAGQRLAGLAAISAGGTGGVAPGSFDDLADAAGDPSGGPPGSGHLGGGGGGGGRGGQGGGGGGRRHPAG